MANEYLGAAGVTAMTQAIMAGAGTQIQGAITTTLDGTSDNTHAAGAKAVVDYVTEAISTATSTTEMTTEEVQAAVAAGMSS